MSSPTYWSQPNQQVVRDGEPVGIVSDDPDPQDAPEPEPEDDETAPAKTSKAKAKS